MSKETQIASRMEAFRREILGLHDKIDSWRKEAGRFKKKWLALDRRHDNLLKALWITAAVIVIEVIQVLAFIWWIK